MVDKNEYLQNFLDKQASVEKTAFGKQNFLLTRLQRRMRPTNGSRPMNMEAAGVGTGIKNFSEYGARQPQNQSDAAAARWQNTKAPRDSSLPNSDKLQGILADNGAADRAQKQLAATKQMVSSAGNLKAKAQAERNAFTTRQQYLGSETQGRQMFAKARVRLPNGTYIKTAKMLPNLTNTLEKIAKGGTKHKAVVAVEKDLNAKLTDLRAFKKLQKERASVEKSRRAGVISEATYQQHQNLSNQREADLKGRLGIGENPVKAENNPTTPRYGGEKPGMFNSIRNTIADHPLTAAGGAALAGSIMFGGNSRDDDYKRAYASVQNENLGDMNNMDMYQYNLEKCASAEKAYQEAAYDMQAAEAMYVEALQKMASAEQMYKIAMSKNQMLAAGGATAGAAALGGAGVAASQGMMGAELQKKVNTAATNATNAVNDALKSGKEAIMGQNGIVEKLQNNWQAHQQAYAPIAGATVGGALGATAGYYGGKRFNAPRAGAVIGGVTGAGLGGAAGYYATQTGAGA